MTGPELYRGRVVRIAGGRPVVAVPRLAPGYEVAAQVLRPAGDDTGTAEGHEHTVPATYAPGDPVLVAIVGGIRDDLVILGRLT